ncbi:succinate-semialdehyde dehydrogenase / glutarate-semialdehyde dehydrogenase [Monaibacterium marinum]|uniref:Succinate-semialdehyde dehydrogenase / glutarate-semialdehyde dehydrogenase n=1 Tax=Pontivivens marinum TaxID=1690039 RepID=A0A2C9CPD3_9RHOB|nr:NAD-dependent succinate-semialdehyde dehydrogenase [Monaibacterium marinum]SOH93102.1 succinate-semialdehyde dehydrogenase / glutarate-semialdehyde dehydrogenase [Monaibacterium marinum]
MKLDNPKLFTTKSYIDGAWVDADNGATFDVTNPVDDSNIAQVADLGRAEVARAIDAANAAQAGWAAKLASERYAILMEWYRLIMANQEDLAKLITAEMGKPLKESRGEVAYGASFIQWFAEEAKRIYGDTIPQHQADKRIVVIKQPIGVVGSITPWNFPLAMITRKLAPGLAAGCTCVARPAELTPLTALALAELAEQAGFPKGVFNVVTGSDSSAMGKELCENDKVRKITFTGSTRVGSILMEQCAGTIKKMSLELGGNAPFLVFDDADIDEAIEGAIICKFRNAGQTCVCANRIYVQAGVYDEFAKKLAARVAQMKVGDGTDADTDIGPLISGPALKKVQEHLDDAVSKGATIIQGGTASDQGGTFFNPTVVTGVTQDMKVAQEETFGPMAPLFKFETEEEGIKLANDTIFGLAAYYYTRDIGRVWRVGEALEYGIVGLNTGLISTEVAPFGGVKQSGLGREGSKYGIEEYLELKYICMGGI